MNGRTDILVKEAREVLEWDILKFWAGMQDPRGGFYGSIAPDLTADKEAVREEQLNARILWAYSNAYRRFRKREYLMPAMNAKDYFIQHFLDHKYGGAFTSVDSWGEKLDTDAHLSNQALAIYALSEFYGAIKDDESLKQAVNLFKIVEKEFKDPVNGGYFETLRQQGRLLPHLSPGSLRQHVQGLEGRNFARSPLGPPRAGRLEVLQSCDRAPGTVGIGRLGTYAGRLPVRS